MFKFFFGKQLFRPWLLCLLLACMPAARALDPAIALDGYRHDRWSEVDGAPSQVDALAQTRDGWLWIASRQTGLFRFDGLRFLPYETRDGSRLQHTSISVLRPGPGNTLWIGHGQGGVSVLRDGRLIHFPGLANAGSVYAISIGTDGSVWIATGRGLYRIRADRVERIGPAQGYGSQRAEYVLADGSGRVWAADGSTLYLLERGAAAFRLVRRVDTDPMVAEASDGSVWLVLGKRFERLAPPRTGPAPPGFGRSSTYQSAFDADGNLWTGNCPVGLCVLRPGAWQGRDAFNGLATGERFDRASQLTSLTVWAVMTDREGSVWIGTSAGLDRLRDQSVHMVPELFDKGRVQALPHPDGGTVALASERLNGTFTLWRLEDGKPVAQSNPLTARVMARAPDGSLVLGGDGGIERQTAAGVERIPLPPVDAAPGEPARIRSIAAGNGEIWVGLAGHGTWRYRDGRWVRYALTQDNPTAISLDGAGRAYLGVSGGGIRIVDGAHERGIALAPGVGIGEIGYIHPGRDIVVSGSRGYGVVRGDRIEAVAVPEGLGPSHGIMMAPDGSVWINATTGLLHVPARDWARTMIDPRVPLAGTLFDALDGYIGGAEANWIKETVAAGRDGRLWLAGGRGLAWIRPAALKPNRIAPDVEILGLEAAGHRHAPIGTLDLGRGTQDVRIDYAAPSLRMPQRVRFRYRLLGAGDAAWEDAGTSRTASYRNLAPGDYTFDVVAVNESGVASSRPAALRFHVAPRLTQSPWFYAACALAGALLLALAHRWRTRRLAQRMEESFQIRVHERESIARSLHDTFLQSVQGMMFSMHAQVMKLPEGPERAGFEQMLQRVGQVLTEGRDEVRGLRSAFDSGAAFWDALLRDVALAAPHAGTRVRIAGAAALDRLRTQLQHDVYAIVREAVVNALRHTSGAVVVRTEAGAKGFVLTVADEGRGFGAHVGGKPGHYGLQGMRERAALIGAKLELADAAGGAHVTLTIPAGLAYEGGRLAGV